MKDGPQPRYKLKRHDVQQPIDCNYRFVPLTQNQNAIVDACNFEYLSRWNWLAQWNPHTESYYAIRHQWNKETKTITKITMASQIVDCPKGLVIDHWDHNTLDNRFGNLRVVTRSQNGLNRLRHERKKVA